ncbi:MAG: hypothetical protein Rubg2KO_15960 [Rubricoccaceae bacterium]
MQALHAAGERLEALDMTAFRHLGFQRAVALLLFAGAGVACIPAASAAAKTQTAFESELRSALGDAEAIELAMDAAQRAPTPESAVDAFVDAYVGATGDTDAAQAIARLLQDHPNHFGAPAVPLNRAVWTVASSTVPLLHRTAQAILTQEPTTAHRLAGATVSPDRAPVPPAPRTLRTQQARAP